MLLLIDLAVEPRRELYYVSYGNSLYYQKFTFLPCYKDKLKGHEPKIRALYNLIT